MVVIIINGNSGVGKDTLCDIVTEEYGEDYVCNYSSIEPIKAIARECGWDGQKDLKDREFLFKLKSLLKEYNDYPFKEVINEFCNFVFGDEYIMFIHIREAEEIERTKNKINSIFLKKGYKHSNCLTMLVKRDGIDKFGPADDLINGYKYDLIYENNQPLDKIKDDFIPWFEKIMDKYNIIDIKERLKYN